MFVVDNVVINTAVGDDKVETVVNSEKALTDVVNDAVVDSIVFARNLSTTGAEEGLLKGSVDADRGTEDDLLCLSELLA
ncbi:hypothetical protein NDU88_004073 [Pleurodeles waltl]|uniref:Uncharacterized protein n=1 Tax=Pleurodeles waltl TaxID=8319 RepID=A0AAV7LH90_PLEWA|nr:hypothetical protein NDU88_004073 [Pleurodeles waltl]